MAEIINLNQARKARTKADNKARAAANRAAHGRSKVEKDKVRVERLRAEQHVDGHKRED